MNKFPIITICCSKRYIRKMINYYNKLTQEGYIVLADLTQYNKQEEFDKELVDKVHLAKIDLADEVHFLLKYDKDLEKLNKELRYSISKEKYMKMVYI